MLCNFVYISVFNRLDQFDFVYGKKIILDFDDMSGSRTTSAQIRGVVTDAETGALFYLNIYYEERCRSRNQSGW